MILNFFAVFIGGGIGALLRYMTGIFCSRHISFAFPVSTFSVNIISCFIIGFAFSYFMHRTGLNPAFKLAITCGFCGGLSTFSSISIEVIEMLRQNNYFLALTYILASVIICISFAFLGMKLGNKIF